MQSKTRIPATQDNETRRHTRLPFASSLRLLAVAAAAALSLGAGAQNVILTQTTLLGGFPNGGAFGSGTAAGVSMAVNSQGNVYVGTSYGGSLVQFNGSTGVQTNLGSYSNIGPVAVDPTNNNLYIGNVYSATIVKLPFVAGTYPAFAAPSGTTPTCTGTDTAECVLPAAVVSGPYGLTSMAFDTKGNLFFASTNGTSAADHSLFECNAACLIAAAPKSTLIYQEPTSATAQLLIGGIAFDSSQNVYFSDSAFTDQGNENSSASYVNQILYTGTGYAAVKNVLYTYKVATPGNFDNEITSVAVDAKDTLYFGTLFDGIFGFTTLKGVVNTATLYTYAPGNTKTMTTDGAGNFYTAAYNGTTKGDALSRVSIGVLAAPTTKLGSASAAVPFTTILNDTLNCSSSTVTYTSASNGAASTEFIASNAGSCATASLSNASAIPGSFVFTPNASGPRSATITAKEANGNTGSAVASGIGLGSPAATPTFSPAGGTYTTIQSVSIADTTANSTIYYTTDGSTPTTASTVYTGPISVASSQTINALATATGSGNSAIGTAVYVINLPAAATPVFTPGAGTYTSIQSIAISTSTPMATIYYTTDGSTPTTASAVYGGPITVAMSETVNAIATATGFKTSALGSAAYLITLPAATPSFGPASGTYNSVQKITISDTTPGAVIHYTTDGSTPTATSTTYTGPITVGVTTTLKAIATASGYIASPVGTAIYTINLPTFSLVIAPNPVTLAYSGGQALVNVTVTPMNTFASAVTFACSGLPTGATCAFTPATVTPNGTFPVTTVMAISTAVTTSALEITGLPLAGFTFGLGLLGWRRRRNLRRVSMLGGMLCIVALAGLGALAGCSGSSTTARTPSTSTVTVTATSGTIVQTGTIAVTLK